jgi:hypothetical protein
MSDDEVDRTTLKRLTEEHVENGGTVKGRWLDDVPEERHFHKCEKCGGWFDKRDLLGMLAHLTDDPCPPNHPVRSN